MRNRKSAEDLAAILRARAKAAKPGTKRAKVLKEINALQRRDDETARVKRYYCTQFRFWRQCRFPPCRRARACKGDADACLKWSVDQVPRLEIRQTQQKLLQATPRHFGAVERRVRETWPTTFWPKRVVGELVRRLKEVRRQREFEEELDAKMNPFGHEGLWPRRR